MRFWSLKALGLQLLGGWGDQICVPLPSAGMVFTQVAIPSPHTHGAEILALGCAWGHPHGGWSGQPRLCRDHLKEETNLWGMGELLGHAEAPVRLCILSARFCVSLFWTWVLADSLSLVTGTPVWITAFVFLWEVFLVLLHEEMSLQV